MRLKLSSNIIPLILWCGFISLGAAENDKRIALVNPNAQPKKFSNGVISVHTNKAIVNWDTWFVEGSETLTVKADSDDALIFFRFKQLPKDIKNLKVSSNASVYAMTDEGLVPLSKKAKSNPIPPTPVPSTKEPLKIEGPAQVLRDR